MAFRRRPPKVSLLLHLSEALGLPVTEKRRDDQAESHRRKGGRRYDRDGDRDHVSRRNREVHLTRPKPAGRNKRCASPSSSQQSEASTDYECTSSSSSSCSITDEDNKESSSDSDSDSDQSSEQNAILSVRGNKQALGLSKKHKAGAAPSASPTKPRARARYQAQAQSRSDSRSKPLVGVHGSAPFQPSNSTFSVYVDPTPAPNPKHGPIPDEEFRKATLEFEKDYNHKRQAVGFAKVNGGRKHPATTATVTVTATPSTQHPANFPRKPLSVTCDNRTTASVTTSVNGTDVGSGDDEREETADKNLHKQNHKAKGDENISTSSSDESEPDQERLQQAYSKTDSYSDRSQAFREGSGSSSMACSPTRAYKYKPPTVESTTNASQETDCGSDDTASDETAPEPLDSVRTSDLLPPQKPAGKPSQPVTPNPTQTQTRTQAWGGSRVTVNTAATKDSGYNSSNVSGTSNKQTSFNDRVGVRTFDSGEPRQDNRYGHNEEFLGDHKQASYHTSPLFTPGRQRDCRGTNAPKGRDSSHDNSSTTTPFDLDGDRFRRQLYEGGVSSLAQEYLCSNIHSPSPPHAPHPAPPPPPPAEQIRMGGYSELAQEYLNPTASRRRRRERAKNSSPPRTTLEDVFYDGNGPSATTDPHNGYSQEYDDWKPHREDTTSGAQRQQRRANTTRGRGASNYPSTQGHGSYGWYGDGATSSARSSHLDPYAKKDGPTPCQAKGNSYSSASANGSGPGRRSHHTNHSRTPYASSSRPSARLPKLPPKGFVEELPDSDSDSEQGSTIAHIGVTSLAFRSPCSVT
ncbi:hypothetical protein ACRALDRAFT_1069602 [Sodiomyces alcalophilus JCM 7366]|uniref:uncharacterized protein n=1 Tax=Sodiomyces alcalophilus JCM 7366 TaxID=591952 RepID=UPI0039B5CA52